MQHNKVIKNNSEIEIIGSNSEQLTSSLTSVMEKFQLKHYLTIFNVLKAKGLNMCGLLKVLIVLPFYGVASINCLMRSKIDSLEVEGKKQAYYDVKNNEDINWRMLLMLCVNRFRYLINSNPNLKSNSVTAIIFDDSLLKKTGKKIERVSIVHDHGSNLHILGFKLLVCGFWDGESFIPVDFSLHRERGTKQEEYNKAYLKSKKAIKKQNKVIESLKKSHQKKQASYLKHKSKYKQSPTNTNNNRLANSLVRFKEINKKLKQVYKEMSRLEKEKTKSYNAMKRSYYKGKLFGLTRKEREAQFKKVVSTKSHGFKRRKESDRSKIKCMLEMLGRAVSKGIVPNYVLVDSWFFCYELLDKLQRIKKGAICLVSMVKINNQIFNLCDTDKDMSVNNIIKTRSRHVKQCRKLKARYLMVKCLYKGVRVNLFFVKMGKCKTWRLLVTTDLSLKFIKLMEIYQIRWSIEVFFKDSKQHLNLSGCQSNIFDAQIADITISMIQYIMLSYFKRLHYQQTIGGLFENLAKELVELDIVSRLIKVFWELIKTLCEICGIDLFELQENMIKDSAAMEQISKLLPIKLWRQSA